MERPELVNRLILDFLAQNRQGAPALPATARGR
jgi:hypothetical protein